MSNAATSSDLWQPPAHGGVFVKVCGLTAPEDAEVLGEADAVGLNFWAPGKRYLAPGLDEEVAAAVPGGVLKVGVFVDEPASRVVETARRVGLDVVQLHGEPDPALWREVRDSGFPVLQALRIACADDFVRFAQFPGAPLLLDAHVAGLPGGTGVRLDTALAKAARELLAAEGRPMFLAGGLNPGNVGNAASAVKPFGVDVASGVEVPGTKPPRKDLAAVRTFIAAARAALAPPVPAV